MFRVAQIYISLSDLAGGIVGPLLNLGARAPTRRIRLEAQFKALLPVQASHHLGSSILGELLHALEYTPDLEVAVVNFRDSHLAIRADARHGSARQHSGTKPGRDLPQQGSIVFGSCHHPTVVTTERDVRDRGCVPF